MHRRGFLAAVGTSAVVGLSGCGQRQGSSGLPDGTTLDGDVAEYRVRTRHLPQEGGPWISVEARGTKTSRRELFVAPEPSGEYSDSERYDHRLVTYLYLEPDVAGAKEVYDRMTQVDDGEPASLGDQSTAVAGDDSTLMIVRENNLVGFYNLAGSEASAPEVLRAAVRGHLASL